MGAECEKHGVDLGGDTFTGLVCPVCKAEDRAQAAEERHKALERDYFRTRNERDAVREQLDRAVKLAEKIQAEFAECHASERRYREALERIERDPGDEYRAIARAALAADEGENR